MPHNTKIATCCYCGKRSVLTFAMAPAHPEARLDAPSVGAPTHHELVCSGCGAALRNLKFIKSAPVPAPQKAEKAPAKKRAPQRSRSDRGRQDLARRDERPRPPRKRKAPPKRRRSFWRMVESVIDEIEDIFD